MRPKGSKNKKPVAVTSGTSSTAITVSIPQTPVEDLRTLLSEKIAKYDTLIAEAAKEIERHQAKISRVNAERAELHSLIEQYNQKMKGLNHG